VYYLFPLAVACVLLAGHEVLDRRTELARVGSAVSRLIGQVAPQLLAVTTFLGGVLLLASGALSVPESRLEWLTEILPLPAVEASHFLGRLAGVGLILLANALQDRLDGAYVASVVLLAAGALLSLFRLHLEQSLVLAAMLAVLLPCRRHFYRRSSIFAEPFSRRWITAPSSGTCIETCPDCFVFPHCSSDAECGGGRVCAEWNVCVFPPPS